MQPLDVAAPFLLKLSNYDPLGPVSNTGLCPLVATEPEMILTCRLRSFTAALRCVGCSRGCGGCGGGGHRREGAPEGEDAWREARQHAWSWGTGRTRRSAPRGGEGGAAGSPSLAGRRWEPSESHRWRAAPPPGRWRVLQEQGAEPEPALESGRCCCWTLGGRPCGTLDTSAASGTRSAGSWEDDSEAEREWRND